MAGRWQGEVVTFRAPRAPHDRHRRVVGPLGLQAIEEAERLLAGDVRGLVGDDALAERERLRRQDEDGRNRQGHLPLGAPDAVLRR